MTTYYEIRDEMGRRRSAFQTREEAVRAVEEINHGTEGIDEVASDANLMESLRRHAAEDS
jgi:hypothetical protein